MIFPLPHIFRPRMLRTGVLGLFAAGLMASTALAEVTPRTGPHDNRVRIATWTEGQVYRIVTTLTRVTTVESVSYTHLDVYKRQVQGIITRIGETEDLHEAIALNTYARAELARLVAIRTRIKAAHTEPLSAEQIAMAAAQAAERQHMDFTLESLQ